MFLVDFYRPKGRVRVPKQMDFRKIFKQEGGVIFNPKIYVADFGNFTQGFLIQNSNFRVQCMTHSQMLGKVESGGGPIFKVYLVLIFVNTIVEKSYSEP